MTDEINIYPLGNDALIIQLEQNIDPFILNKVITISHEIELEKINGVKEVVPAYASLAVYYDPIVVSYKTLKNHIELHISGKDLKDKKTDYILWNIPVCYELGIDLVDFSSKKQLLPEQVIRYHTIPEYLVYMRGFVPGFLYLGGLDEKLYQQRKSSPTRKVPSGSVAIGGQQTGIYSLPGPAGWHVIGQTPFKLFDPESIEIMKIKPGDKVKFKAISKGEFDRKMSLSDRSITGKKLSHD